MKKNEKISGRAGMTNIISGPDVNTTTLIYPVTVTSGTEPTTFKITPPSGSTGQFLLHIRNSSAANIWAVPIDGGPVAVASSAIVYPANGIAAQAAQLNGVQNPPCLNLPDGTQPSPNPAIGIWSGTGPPTSNTVGSANIGDLYYSRGACVLIAATYGNLKTITVGLGTVTGTQTQSGTPSATEDLVVVVACSTNSSLTMTIGSTSAVAATSTDGGITYNDGTDYVRIFSHVVQSGDISSNKITCTASATFTGTNPQLTAMIFRHPAGWTALSSADKFGCAPFAVNGTDVTSGTSDFDLSVTGPSTYPQPSVVVVAQYGTSGTPTINFDSYYSEAAITFEMPHNTAYNSQVICKPGLGYNDSAHSCYPVNGSSVVISSQPSGAKAAGMAMWIPAGTSNPIIYRCTVAGTGSSGTWVQML